MKSKELKILYVFLLVAFSQIALHWFLSTDNAIANYALRLYLSHNPHSRKGVAGYIDFAVPAAVIGFSIGRIAHGWTLTRIFVANCLVGGAVASLAPAYAFLLRGKDVWWWPKAASEIGLWFVGNLVMTVFLAAVFSYWGRLCGMGRVLSEKRETPESR